MLTHNLDHGRLGNQLFQIASTIGIGIKNNLDYSFPNWKYHFWWPKVPTDAVYVTEYYDEGQNNNFHGFPTLKPGTALRGYYQSSKYFDHCKDVIHEMLRPNTLFEFNDKKVVGIHVRRADYLNHGWWVGGIYYQNAINLFNRNEYTFAIMSDDYDWCRKNFNMKNQFFCDQFNEYECLSFGMACDYLIMANSSFSWWMGYFGKEVIYPEFTVGNFPNKDFYLKSWKSVRVK